MIRRRFVLFLCAGALVVSGLSCDTEPILESTVLLICFDGFRWDYLEKAPTPNLDRFITTGVKAKALLPVFPTETYPNLYSIVTGLYPKHHGIVANVVHDPLLGGGYYFGLIESGVDHSQWWEAEPIWVTAERAGLITASAFWPGSTVEIGGERVTYSLDWNDRYSMSHEDRVSHVLAWLDLPASQRPRFITLYFPDTDVRGHQFGPDSPEIALTIRRLDNAMGELFWELVERGLMEEINIIIVSDHGMTPVSTDRLIFLDDYVDHKKAGVITWGAPVLPMWLSVQYQDQIYDALKDAHPHLQIYRRGETPARFHYYGHRRIPPLIGLADEGWHITTRHSFEKDPGQVPAGHHGYDPALPSMWGIFMARGPAFKSGLIVEPFQNIHIYELIAHVLGLAVEPNDGNLYSVKTILAQ